MSRTEQLFAQQKKQTIKPDRVNADGYAAYSVSIEEDYVQMVMTNTIGNTYYMSDRGLFKQSMDLHARMLKKDPKFMAQTAVYGRNGSLMRTQPIIALAHLSTIENKEYFKAAFPKVIKTPNDLIDFITVLGKLRHGRGLGRSVKREVNNFLNTVGEYWAIKYGGGSEGWTLKDIIKACHPVPLTKTQGTLFNYLVGKELDAASAAKLDQIACVEALKKLSTEDKDYTKKAIQLIERGKLPHEVVTGIVSMNTEIWEYVMKQMPIFALTRNLSTLDKAGVLSTKANVDYVVGQLTNADIIRRSRMLPFRFPKAYKMFAGNPKISAALSRALDLSLCNAQPIPGTTAWFMDVSGSMQGDYLEIGSLLAIAGLKQSADSLYFTFESDLHCPRLNINDSVMSNMKAAQLGFGGGTNTSLTIKHLLGEVKPCTEGFFNRTRGYSPSFPESMKTSSDNPIFVNNIVIVTDEAQNTGSPVIEEFRKYRKKVNPNAKLFIIDVAPYEGRLANDKEPGVTFIYGWSDSVLDILAYSVESGSKHVDIIRNVVL